MFSRAFRIGSISGISIRVDPSWFLIAALFAFGFFAWFPRYGHGPAAALVLAVTTALLFFLSVLAHELGHALEAQHRGVAVGGITLFLFGGVTETHFDVRRPFDEFALSAVGPYVSFVVAALFGLIATGATTLGLGAVADVAGVLGWLNLILAVFNLLPGAPLDGGRILRALAWRLTGDRPRSVRIAARAGQALGGAVVALAIYQALVLGQLLAGLFNAFIGWFLFAAAGAEHHLPAARGLGGDRDVGALVGPPPAAIPADLPLGEVAARMSRSDRDAHPVADGGEVVGVVHVDDVARAGGGQPAELPLRAVMRPLSSVEALAAATPVSAALDRLERDQVAAVLDGDQQVAGLVTGGDLERTLERLHALEGDDLRRAAAGVERPEEPA